MGREIRVILVTALAALQALQIVGGSPGFLHGGDYLPRALLYSFFHANVWHLAVNALAVWAVYAPARWRGWWPDLILPFLIAVAVYPLASRPVIGFSNVLYAVLGLRTPSLESRWWRSPEVALFLAVTLAMLAVPRFSAVTHIVSFVAGTAIAAARRGWKELTRDAERYL